MAIILNIDTAFDSAYITLAEDGVQIAVAENQTQKEHAAWIQAAIKELLQKNQLTVNNLSAVGVNIGPGSYTGLRIGLSTAKGLCYALKIPLITEVSLKLLAFTAINYISSTSPAEDNTLIYCPMIDARRMEVFMALYDRSLKELTAPQSLVLNEDSLATELSQQKILFIGNGAHKFRSLCSNSSASFPDISLNPTSLSTLTYRNFIGNDFADLYYVDPLYVKEFFSK